MAEQFKFHYGIFFAKVDEDEVIWVRHLFEELFEKLGLPKQTFCMEGKIDDMPDIDTIPEHIDRTTKVCATMILYLSKNFYTERKAISSALVAAMDRLFSNSERSRLVLLSPMENKKISMELLSENLGFLRAKKVNDISRIVCNLYQPTDNYDEMLKSVKNISLEDVRRVDSFFDRFLSNLSTIATKEMARLPPHGGQHESPPGRQHLVPAREHHGIPLEPQPGVSQRQEPGQQPLYQPGQQLMYQLMQQPLYRPGQQPVNQPGQQPMYQPGQQQPMYQPRQQPMYQPGQQPMYQPGQQPMYQPGQQLVNQTGQQPIYQPGKQLVNQPGQQPIYQPGQQPVRQPGQQPLRQPVHQHVYQPGQRPLYQYGQPVYQAGQQPMYQPGQQPMYQPGQDPVSQPGQQPVTQHGQQPLCRLVYQPGQPPVSQPGQQPLIQSGQQLVYQPGQPPVNQPRQPPVNQPGQPPMSQPSQPPISQPGQPPMNQPRQPPVDQPGQPPVSQPGQPPMSQPAQTGDPSNAEPTPVRELREGVGALRIQSIAPVNQPGQQPCVSLGEQSVNRLQQRVNQHGQMYPPGHEPNQLDGQHCPSQCPNATQNMQPPATDATREPHEDQSSACTSANVNTASRDQLPPGQQPVPQVCGPNMQHPSSYTGNALDQTTGAPLRTALTGDSPYNSPAASSTNSGIRCITSTQAPSTHTASCQQGIHHPVPNINDIASLSIGTITHSLPPPSGASVQEFVDPWVPENMAGHLSESQSNTGTSLRFAVRHEPAGDLPVELPVSPQNTQQQAQQHPEQPACVLARSEGFSILNIEASS